jgi:hypothetical protein
MSNIITKTFEIVSIKKSDNPDKRSFDAIITTSTLDRDGEVVLAEGVNYSNYLKSGGPVYYNHDHNRAEALPIGKTDQIWKSKGQVKANIKLAKRSEDIIGPYFPDYVWSLIDQDIIKGISIGYIPVESRYPSKKDLADYGKNVKRIISKVDLIEVSIAPLQANTEALITAVNKNLLDATLVKKYFDIDLEKKDKEIDIIIEKIEKKDIDINIEIKEKTKKEIEIEILKKVGKVYLD